MKKNIIIVAKRKTVIARGVVTEGAGKVTVNGKLLSAYSESLFRMIASEPMIIAAELAQKYDIDIMVAGGGTMGRAHAVRSVIAKGLSKKEKTLKKKFLEYDRSLLVDDKRQTEAQKPYRSSARALKQTSYR
ncbi:MAG: 30S ribosomal protein S9 [Candidatus Parvarchaeota archaeon]|jgi:small subunit ribosomal protein S9|nr:30S ribosomal protein S9 [Candidatus Parvarchaeota archaeon]